MVSRSLPAGIGAVGFAKARFFHPSDKIRAKWPNDNKRQLVNVLVIGEGQRIVNIKNQWCYIARIPEIDDGSEFHIVKFNFTVNVAPKVPFPGEINRGPRSRRQRLLVMFLQTLAIWETTSRISGAKESKSTTTTNQRPKTPNLP
jgi:hypothetical protein